MVEATDLFQERAIVQECENQVERPSEKAIAKQSEAATSAWESFEDETSLISMETLRSGAFCIIG